MYICFRSAGNADLPQVIVVKPGLGGVEVSCLNLNNNNDYNYIDTSIFELAKNGEGGIGAEVVKIFREGRIGKLRIMGSLARLKQCTWVTEISGELSLLGAVISMLPRRVCGLPSYEF